MKSLKLYTIIILLACLNACKPEEFGPIGEPRVVLKNLAGTWTISKVTQIDNDAVKKGFPYTSMDITNVYPYKEFKLTFNLNEKGDPSTFTSVSGNSPQIISLVSGSWTTDDALAPKVLTFKSGAVESKIEMGSYNSFNNNKLILRVIRILSGKPVVTYEYEFSKN